MTDPVSQYVHGPYKAVEKAREDAYMLVDPPITQWSVVELFGPEFDKPARDGSDETWGMLFVVPTDRADEFAESRGAESHGIVDTYGYDASQEDA